MTSAETAPQVADCLFCRIATGKVPANILAETDNALAFYDIDPQAPIHVLVIPREHYPNAAALAEADPDLLAELVILAQTVASERANGDFRLVFNSGAEAGQSVFHVHGHVLAGRKLGWTPA